jgi:hypothetical protein
MSVPATFNNPSFGADDLKDEKLRLAVEEGHDADIPTNEGVYEMSGEKEAQIGTASATETEEKEDKEHDPNVVFWDEPVDQDPANPQNWKDSFKWLNIAIVSFITLITYVASCLVAFLVTMHGDITGSGIRHEANRHADLSHPACLPLASHRSWQTSIPTAIFLLPLLYPSTCSVLPLARFSLRLCAKYMAVFPFTPPVMCYLLYSALRALFAVRLTN